MITLLQDSAWNGAPFHAPAMEASCQRVPRTASEWEARFAPYDETTYVDALAALSPKDVVLDIGAGDLRFTRRAAERVRRVTAIEQRAELLWSNVPRNVRVICGDARRVEFPQDISAAVLLMRHCRDFSLYRQKLESAGCERLITNARWGMSVEVIYLNEPRILFSTLEGGWYGCECGRAGFKPGDFFLESVIEVKDCPACLANGADVADLQPTSQ